MADDQPNPNPTPTPPPVDNTGTISGAALTQAIVAAVEAGVATALSTMVNQVNNLQNTVAGVTSRLDSLSENVTKISQTVSGESDVGYTLRSIGVANPADDAQRMMKQRDEVGTVSLKMLTSMVENADAMMKEYMKYTAAKWSTEAEYQSGVWSRSLDHFSSLPPIQDAPPNKRPASAG